MIRGNIGVTPFFDPRKRGLLVKPVATPPPNGFSRCFCYVGAFGGRVGGDLGCWAGLVVTKVAAKLTPTGGGIPTTGLDAWYLRGRARRSAAAPAIKGTLINKKERRA